MRALEALLLRRADEQADQALSESVAKTQRRHSLQAIAKCACGRPVYGGADAMCCQCRQRIRDASPKRLARKNAVRKARAEERGRT